MLEGRRKVPLQNWKQLHFQSCTKHVELKIMQKEEKVIAIGKARSGPWPGQTHVSHPHIPSPLEFMGDILRPMEHAYSKRKLGERKTKERGPCKKGIPLSLSFNFPVKVAELKIDGESDRILKGESSGENSGGSWPGDFVEFLAFSFLGVPYRPESGEERK